MRAIAQRLFITDKAVSKHCTSIFAKLNLRPDEDDNRRVLAVLAYLNSLIEAHRGRSSESGSDQ